MKKKGFPLSKEDLVRALEDLINAIHAPAHMLIMAYQRADLVLREAKKDLAREHKS